MLDSWSPRALVSQWAAALLLIVPVPGCGHGARPFTAYADLSPHLAEVPREAADLELEQQLRGLSKTDRVHVRELGIPVVFDGLDLPGDSTVSLRVLPRRMKQFRGQQVRARFLARAQGGALVDEQLASATFEPGQYELPLGCTFDAGSRIARIEIELSAPGIQDGPEQRVGIVRPLATFPGLLEGRPGSAPRQVVLVTLDTLRRDYLPMYGDELVRAPRLAAFAAEAVVFDGCYSVANQTNPSHFSIFSSLHPKDHGVDDNFTALPAECPVLMDQLEAEGFATAGFVGSQNFQPERSAIETRFQDFYPCRLHWERRAEDVNLDVFPWLVEHRAEDFFVWVHYFDAHMPYAPPFPYDRMYTARGTETIELPVGPGGDPELYASDNLQFYKNMYMGEISYLDQQFGELLDYMRAVGVYERSLIVVVADHGEALGEHGIYCEHKGLYESTTAVPLIVKTPGQSERGRVAGLVSTLDIHPTVLDYLELQPVSMLRGTSLAGLMRESRASPQTAVYSEHAWSSQVAVRTLDHRAVLDLADVQLFPRFALRAGRLEFFSVDRPREVDITDACSGRAEATRAELLDFLADGLSLEAQPIEDPEYLENLRKLGYTR